MTLMPSATTRSGDAGYWENMMTFNTDCAQAAGRFYCTAAGSVEEEIKLDLNNVCIVNSIYYRWQDPGQDCYRLIIEVSADGETYSTILNHDTATSGQDFYAYTTSETQLVRYIRIRAHHTAGWTNCNTLEVLGYGSTK